MTTTDKPIIPGNIRLTIYLISGIGTPLITLVLTVLGIIGIIDAKVGVEITAAFAAFFGGVAGLFGISHFTRN